MIILPDQGLIFVAVPRTGSQSIAYWLQKNFYLPGKGYPATREHQKLDELQTTEFEHFKSFCVIRDPLSRLISICARFDPNFHSNPVQSILKNLLSPLNRFNLPQTILSAGVKTKIPYEKFTQIPDIVGDLVGVMNLPKIPHYDAASPGGLVENLSNDIVDLVKARYLDDFKLLELLNASP